MNSPSIIRFLRRINPGSSKDAQVELDIERLSKEDVQSLRTTDPFMYYSIPGIRRANMNLQGIEDIDHSNTGALCSSEVQTPRKDSSAPPKNKRSRRSTKVTRQTCISCEAHPHLLMEELFEELRGMSEDALKQFLFDEVED